MFIREIKKRITTDGKKYDYLQHRLVEAIRTPNGPRQHTVLNLGTLTIDKDKHKTLANLIEAIVTKNPQQGLFKQEPELVGLAQHFAEIIIRKRLQQQERQNPAQRTQATSWYETIDLNSTTTSAGRTIGAEHIALSQLKELGLFEILQECRFSVEQQHYAAAQICARMVHPSSERETARWLRDDSGLDELLGVDFSRISDHTLHRTADQLLQYKEILEEQLSETTSNLFSLDNSLVLYDLTNSYFESPKRGSAIAAYGKSKEKRTDCPLVTLALIVDGYGFPKRSHVFPGNASEPETLWKILETLDQQDPQAKPRTVIVDAGIATEENLQRLREDNRFEYVAVSRKQKFPLEIFEQSPEHKLEVSRNNQLTIKIARCDDEAFLLCQSPLREAKEKSMLSSRRAKFERDLEFLREGLNKSRTRKKYDSIVERIGRIKERYGLGKFYMIEVIKRGDKAIDITWRFEEEKRKPPGQYIIRTSRTDLEDQEISMLHRTLTMIESAFRWLKSELGMRPNFHQLDSRIEAHLCISVLAYYGLAPILSKLNWGGQFIGASRLNRDHDDWEIPYGWKGVLRTMASQTRVTTSFLNKNQERIDVRTTLEPTEKQRHLYQRLNLSSRPLKRVIAKK